jgi:hypothetical protein
MKAPYGKRRIWLRISNCELTERWNELRMNDSNGKEVTRERIFAINAQREWQTQINASERKRTRMKWRRWSLGCIYKNASSTRKRLSRWVWKTWEMSIRIYGQDGRHCLKTNGLKSMRWRT